MSITNMFIYYRKINSILNKFLCLMLLIINGSYNIIMAYVLIYRSYMVLKCETSGVAL